MVWLQKDLITGACGCIIGGCGEIYWEINVILVVNIRGELGMVKGKANCKEYDESDQYLGNLGYWDVL